MENTLKYYKENCEENYITTPISVLRHISELEERNSQLLKQRDELIKFVVDTMTAMPINSTIYKKADELLTKTQTK